MPLYMLYLHKKAMFGKKLKEIRLARSMSIDELSTLTGISKSYLYYIEKLNSMSSVKVSTIEDICNAIGIELPAFVLHISDPESDMLKQAKELSKAYIENKKMIWKIS